MVYNLCRMPPEVVPNIGPETRSTPEKCHHHWIIESPNGEFSKGVCKHCGNQKDDFKNGEPALSGYNAIAVSIREIYREIQSSDPTPPTSDPQN